MEKGKWYRLERQGCLHVFFLAKEHMGRSVWQGEEFAVIDEDVFYRKNYMRDSMYSREATTSEIEQVKLEYIMKKHFADET